MKKLVKNDIVKMEWDADLFIANVHVGFLGAVHDYHGIGVVFQEGKVYAFVDDIGALDAKTMKKLLKDSYKVHRGADASVEVLYEMDEYTEYTDIVCGEEVVESNVSLVGLTEEDVADILKRCEDLSGYFDEIVVD